MIITLNATKDTYVTDIKTKHNDGSVSNVGQAATVDLFKIKSTSSTTKARALLKLAEGSLTDGDTFQLEDAAGQSVTFEFDVSNNEVAAGKIEINDDAGSYIDHIVSQINAQANLNITAYKLNSTQILLEQDTAGKTGIKQTTVNVNTAAALTITNFVLFEHSVGLLGLPIKTLNSTHVDTFANSVFNDTAKFKANIVLSDVGVSNTRAKDFTLTLQALNNLFDEGLGSDTIHFSDEDIANFTSISTTSNWTVPNFITETDFNVSLNSFSSDTFNIVKGDEDLRFNITPFIKGALGEATVTDHDFAIYFSLDNMFDDYSYFVKRLGSNRLKNKLKVPRLEIKIKDDELEFFQSTNKKRYLNNAETFYLKNLVDNNLQSFPAGFTPKLKLEFLGNVRDSERIEFLRNPVTGDKFTITDGTATSISVRFTYADNSGITSEGGTNYYIGLFDLSQGNITLSEAVTKIATQLLKKVTDNTLSNLSFSASGNFLTITNSSLSESNIFTTVTDANTTMIIKRTSSNKNILTYNSTGTDNTNYTGKSITGIKKFTVGNTVLSRFNSNSTFQTNLTTNGYVTVKLTYYYDDDNSTDEFVIKTEDVKFYNAASSNLIFGENLRSVINLQQEKLYANNTIDFLKITFIDINKQYDSVKVPVDLVSENIGNVYYEMYDIDTNEKIIEYIESEKEYTKLYYNGDYYIMNLFSSEFYKNRRVNFKFYYTDAATGFTKQIQNNNLNIRFE